jgi:60 kDa SS-A/Ro ribonucleoprotein
MKNLLKTVNTYLNARNTTPQTMPAPGRSDMVMNNAGGFTFAVSDEQRFMRFLILGTEGNSFYQSEFVRTKQEAGFVETFVAVNGLRAVELITLVARENRAPKPEPSLFALAAAAKLGDLATRKAAFAALAEVARTGTHVLHFLAFIEAFGGWGRLTRNAIAGFYNSLPLPKLALWAVKYKSRDGWSQRDALRLAHPKSDNASRNAVFKYMTSGELVNDAGDEALRVIEGHLLAQNATSDAAAAALMQQYRLPIEAVPSEWRGPAVYEAALATGGLTWTLRNLGNLGKHGLLVAGNWPVIGRAVGRITDPVALKNGRIHPIDALKALLTYKNGRGMRGDGTWPVVPQIVDALEQAFYSSFGLLEPAGKRFLLGIDVSGSMTCGTVGGVLGLTPNIAAATMAMVTLRCEQTSHIMGFADRFRDLGVRASDNLEAVVKKTNGMSFGSTDCAQPMLWAAQNKILVDTFVVYTDNETYFGNVHPLRALQDYRQKFGIAARLIVVGMTAGRFTIADPNDAGMLDLVGFDSAAPRIITEFAAGRI